LILEESKKLTQLYAGGQGAQDRDSDAPSSGGCEEVVMIIETEQMTAVRKAILKILVE